MLVVFLIIPALKSQIMIRIKHLKHSLMEQKKTIAWRRHRSPVYTSDRPQEHKPKYYINPNHFQLISGHSVNIL